MSGFIKLNAMPGSGPEEMPSSQYRGYMNNAAAPADAPGPVDSGKNAGEYLDGPMDAPDPEEY